MSPEDIDRILSNHREFETLDRVLKASPRAVQMLIEEQQRIERGESGDAAAAGGGADEPVAFDEASWPFETETPQGKALLQLARQNHELSSKYRTLEQQVTGVRTGFERQTVAQIEGQWKQVAFQAANELDQVYRPMFIRNIRREFSRLQAAGQLTRANAKDVIDAELREVRQAKKSAQRSTVTSQSATAAGNRNLPRAPRPGTVVPATGKETTGKRETIKDARSSFLSKYR